MARPVPAIKVFRPIWRRNFSASTSRSAINKLCKSAEEAVKDVKGNSTLLVGGFGFSGVPNTLINAVHARSEVKNLTVVSNNAGMPGAGLGRYNVFYVAINSRTNISTHRQANCLSPSRSPR